MAPHPHDSLAGKDYQGPPRWQWQTNMAWNEYGTKESRSIEASFQSGERFCNFWSGGLLHEIDLKVMQQTPTYRKVRRDTSVPKVVHEPPPQFKKHDVPITGNLGKVPQVGVGLPLRKEGETGSKKRVPLGPFAIGVHPRGRAALSDTMNSSATASASATATTSRPVSAGANVRGQTRGELPASPSGASLKSSKLRQLAWGAEQGEAKEGNSSGSNADAVEGDGRGLSRLMHPLMLQMPEPVFRFESEQHEHKCHSRKGEMTVDYIAALSQEYQDILQSPNAVLPLPQPIGSGSKAPDMNLVMAALSLALYAATPSSVLLGEQAQHDSRPSTSSEHRSRSLSSLGGGLGDTQGSFATAQEEAERPGTAPSKISRSGSSRSGSRRVSKEAMVHRRHLAKGLTFSLGRDTPATRSFGVAFRDVWRDWVRREKDRVHRNDLWDHAAVPFILSGGNNAVERLERLMCAVNTMRHVSQLRSGFGPVIRVKMLRPVSRRAPLSAAAAHKLNVSGSLEEGCFEKAVQAARRGERVVVCITCSPCKVGGAFVQGRCRGQEEEACMRSSLYPLLWEAARQSRQGVGICDSFGRETHIPDDGAVLCHEVEVFRTGMKRGFVPLEKPVTLAGVLCITLPNLTARSGSVEQDLDGAPVGILEKAPKVAEARLRDKMSAILEGVREARARTVVLSDERCADLWNSADTMGQVWGEEMAAAAVSAPAGTMPNLVLCGTNKFRAAFNRALSGGLHDKMMGN